MGPDVVILGHSGFIGRSLMRSLTACGRTVIGVSSRECDLTNQEMTREWLARLPGPFDLIHAAVVNRAAGQSYDAFTRNCRMLYIVLDSLAPGQCRSFIYLSSVDVYGAHSPCPLSETTLPCPAHYYALAKLTCEGLLRLFPARDFPAAILRLPGVYGVDDGGASLIGRLIRSLMSGQAVALDGDGGLQRDLVCVDDLTAVVAALLDRPGDLLVNVATGESLSLLDMVAIIAEKAQCRPRIDFRPERVPPANLLFDTTHLSQICPGIRLRRMEEGISSYIAALR